MDLNTSGAWWASVIRFGHSVVLRLLATVFLFSFVVTLLLTALQLYRDYDRGITLVGNRLADIDRSYRDSLGEALWRLDQPQLQLELGGILRLADIRAAEVRETGTAATPMVVTAGERMTGAVMAREFPILYRVQGKEQRIGTLYVEATLANLYRELKRTALVILISQAANTFIVSLFTIYILSRLVTRHLATIARTVGSYDFRDVPRPLSLQRRQPGKPDELDRMVAAFNAMGTRAYRAYRHERDAAAEREMRRAAEAANRGLEERVEQRTEELARANASLTSEVDERRRVEARLQSSEVRFRTIVETSPVPLCITSMPDGRILYTNEPLRVLFGLDLRNDAVSNIVDFYVDASERDRLVAHLRREGSFRNTEVQFRRPDGTTFWAMATARVATYDDAPAIYVGLNDITERKRIEQELFESREQLRELSAYMEAIREEERKRIAMEIHDELGQLLTALKMDLSLLKMRVPHDSDIAKKTDDMLELVEKTIWMVRNVASHLRPAALNFGIVSALEWLVEDFGRRNGIPCHFRMHCSEPVLTDAHATAVFRIVQASLTNVARHAGASRVDVTLSGSDKALDLHVSDDGCGFDPAAAQRGYSYGLLGMSERARLIGGSLQIDSAPDTGTVVSIHIPLGDGPQDGPQQ